MQNKQKYIIDLINKELIKSFEYSIESNNNQIPFWLILYDLLKTYNNESFYGKIELTFNDKNVSRPKRLYETQNIQEKYHEILINVENII